MTDEGRQDYLDGTGGWWWLRGQPKVPPTLPLHRTEAGWPSCSTCDGGGCPDCTDPA